MPQSKDMDKHWEHMSKGINYIHEKLDQPVREIISTIEKLVPEKGLEPLVRRVLIGYIIEDLQKKQREWLMEEVKRSKEE